MLKGIDPRLTPDLLHAMACMGHGDRLVIADANFPAASHARRLVPLHGVIAPDCLKAILTLLPIDDFEPAPIAVMQVVNDPAAVPAVVAEFAAILQQHGLPSPASLDRATFYAAAVDAFVIVQTGERRFYGNLLLTKGVIAPP